MVPELIHQRLERSDVRGELFDCGLKHELVKLDRRQRLVQPRPTAVPGLELRAGQARLDLHHAGTEEVKCLLVQLGRSLEVKAELKLAGAGVVPGLEVDLRPAEVELEQAAVTPACLAPAQLRRELRLDPIAQAAEEVVRSEDGGLYQPPEYIS